MIDMFYILGIIITFFIIRKINLNNLQGFQLNYTLCFFSWLTLGKVCGTNPFIDNE